MMLVIEAAFILAVLGAIDSLLTSLVADNMTRTRHDFIAGIEMIFSLTCNKNIARFKFRAYFICLFVMTYNFRCKKIH